MKKFKRISCLVLAIVAVFSLSVSAFADEWVNGSTSTGRQGHSLTGVDDGTVEKEDLAVVDDSAKGSITIYKYDMTQAYEDGVWDVSKYTSDGEYDANVNEVLGNTAITNPSGTGSSVKQQLGNGQTSNSYAIKGVEFTYLKVGSFFTYTENESGVEKIIPLYGILESDGLLPILFGTQAAAKAASYIPSTSKGYPDTEFNNNTYYFTSDALIDALEAKLASATRTATKDALEAYIATYGTKMTETDSNGQTSASNLDLGLYLIVETKVPEMVTSTTAPFLVSVPMTAVQGGYAGDDLSNGQSTGWTRNADGGNRWVYDITLYPKNETGIPTLEKTVREAEYDTGKNNGTNVGDDGFTITDGYLHNATASDGDVLEFQYISRIPSITSDATNIAAWQYTDLLPKGIEYQQDSVQIQIFADDDCSTTPIATWKLTDSDAKFVVNFAKAGDSVAIIDPVTGNPVTTVPNSENLTENRMIITITAAGLAEINNSAYVRTAADFNADGVMEDGSKVVGYSDYVMRVTYKATMDSDTDVIYGDKGNDSDVSLMWKRTNTSYYDYLVDDVHIYTYGIDLTKQFSSTGGDFSKVEFRLYNATDEYYVQAVKGGTAGAEWTSDGIYYVVDNAEEADHSCEEADGTLFVPNDNGKIVIKGLEDDVYTLIEVRTSNGYTLLKDYITVEIAAGSTDGVAKRLDGTTIAKVVCDVYDDDTIGLIQNDARWDGDESVEHSEWLMTNYIEGSAATSGSGDKLSHYLLSASAQVDGNNVTMGSDDGSANALAPLTVLNTRGFTLPQTGSDGNWMFPVVGVSAMVIALAVIVLVARKKESASEA